VTVSVSAASCALRAPARAAGWRARARARSAPRAGAPRRFTLFHAGRHFSIGTSEVSPFADSRARRPAAMVDAFRAQLDALMGVDRNGDRVRARAGADARSSQPSMRACVPAIKM
jgi:hypothetical protein